VTDEVVPDSRFDRGPARFDGFQSRIRYRRSAGPGASTGRYTISTNFPLPPLPFLVGDGASVADSVDNPDYRNCVMRATVRFNNSVTNTLLFGRAGSTPGEDFYSFALNNVEDRIFITRVVTAGDVTDLAFTEFELTEGVDYNVEARMSGERLSLKVWVASDSEPQHPQLVAFDPAFQQQTGAGVAIYNEIGVGGQLTATFDNVSYTRGQSQ